MCLEAGPYGVPSFSPHSNGLQIHNVSFCSAAVLSKKSIKEQQGHGFFSPQATFHSLQHKFYLIPVVETVSGRYLSAELMTDCFKSIVCAYRDGLCLTFFSVVQHS